MYEQMKSPIQLGKLELKNKIIFAPTSMGLKEEAYFEKMKQIAEGGVALIIIGDVITQKSQRTCLHQEEGFAYYKRLVEVVHAAGAKISAQLYMSDYNPVLMRQYMPQVLAKKMAMDDLRTLLNEGVSEFISEMPIEEVRRIIKGFGETAKLAQAAGFDMVQVHGDRMGGSFSSGLFNKRTDCYGGSVANRARFAVESILSIKEATPDLPIDYKLAVRQENPHYGNAGVLVEELSEFIPLLEGAGVDSFHVTLANHSDLKDVIPGARHEYFSEEGCFLKFCDEVRNYTTLPICGVGGLSNPEFIEAQLKSGRIDCVGMSRQLVADPNWFKKVVQGEAYVRCIRCNKACLGGQMSHQGVSCIFDQKES